MINDDFILLEDVCDASKIEQHKTNVTGAFSFVDVFNFTVSRAPVSK